MDEQNLNNLAFPENYSFNSQPSINLSIEKISQHLSDRPLSAKPSIIQALDLDCMRGRKSSFGRFSQVDEDSQSRNLRLSTNSCKDFDSKSITQQKYQMFQEIPNFNQNPVAYSKHQCICTKQCCNFNTCPCLFAINQLCPVGLCCLRCIRKKNSFLKNDIDPLSFQYQQKKHNISKQKRQNNHIKSIKKAQRAKVQKQKYDFVYCTCKKTQCLKKYCPCFAVNKQCNECCICEDCHNHQDQDENSNSNAECLNRQEVIPVEGESIQHEKIETMIQENIDNYFEESPENYDNVELNKAMDFDPVDFSEFNK